MAAGALVRLALAGGRQAVKICLGGTSARRWRSRSWWTGSWTTRGGKERPGRRSFEDIEGDLKPRPRFKTQAKMAWDDEYFYVGGEAGRAACLGRRLTEHDAVIFQDNDFEVFLDPDGDNHQYYEVEINALGTEWDLRLVKPYRDGGPALNEWEIPGLKKGVHVQGTLNDASDEDEGWTVEMAFPWKVLAEFTEKATPPKDGDQWRVNFSSVQWLHTVEDGKYVKVPGRREDNWVWSPQGVIDMHRPEKWGYVQFSEKADATDVAFARDVDQTDSRAADGGLPVAGGIQERERAMGDEGGAGGPWRMGLR